MFKILGNYKIQEGDKMTPNNDLTKIFKWKHIFVECKWTLVGSYILSYYLIDQLLSLQGPHLSLLLCITCPVKGSLFIFLITPLHRLEVRKCSFSLLKKRKKRRKKKAFVGRWRVIWLIDWYTGTSHFIVAQEGPHGFTFLGAIKPRTLCPQGKLVSMCYFNSGEHLT